MKQWSYPIVTLGDSNKLCYHIFFSCLTQKNWDWICWIACNFALLCLKQKTTKNKAKGGGDGYQMEQGKIMGVLSNQQPQQKHVAMTTILLPETDSNPASGYTLPQILPNNPNNRLRFPLNDWRWASKAEETSPLLSILHSIGPIFNS